MNNRKRFLYYVLVALWMVLIFWFSSAGHEVSSGQSTGVVEGVRQVTGVELPEKIVRKAAHVMLYFVLGVLLKQLLRTHDLRRLKISWLAILLAGAYAVTDEAHQLLVGGRSGQIGDVILDTTAAAIGVMALFGTHHLVLLHKKQ